MTHPSLSVHVPRIVNMVLTRKSSPQWADASPLRLKPQRKCAYFLFSLHEQIAGSVPVSIIVSYVKRGWLLISNLWTANIMGNTHAFYFLPLDRPESQWIEINRCLSSCSSWDDLPHSWGIKNLFFQGFLLLQSLWEKMSTGLGFSSASYSLCDFGKLLPFWLPLFII